MLRIKEIGDDSVRRVRHSLQQFVKHARICCALMRAEVNLHRNDADYQGTQKRELVVRVKQLEHAMMRFLSEQTPDQHESWADEERAI